MAETNGDEALETGPGHALDEVLKTEGGTQPEPEAEWREHTALATEQGKVQQGHSEHSPWPFVVAIGLLLVGFGLLNQVALVVLGGIVVMVAAVGWLWEPWVG